MKHNHQGKLTVLFNSLDQLKARFPLCARQDIFIPGIIGSLSGENVTSIFIAVDERGQPEEQYGLIPMSDLVLSFRFHRFNLTDYYKHLESAGIGKASSNSENVTLETLEGSKEAIVLKVLRFSGGEMAGTMGILELVNHPEVSLYDSAGLQYVQMQPAFGYGKLVQ